MKQSTLNVVARVVWNLRQCRPLSNMFPLVSVAECFANASLFSLSEYEHGSAIDFIIFLSLNI